MTALLDTSPFRLIEFWAALPVTRLRYGRIDVARGTNRYALFWAEPAGQQAMIFVTPCSLIVAETLATHLQRVAARTGLNVVPHTLAGEELERVEPIVQYLFGTEHWFDFSARVDS